MNTRQIPKGKWKNFFDGIASARQLASQDAEVEVLGLNLGDQIAAEWIPIVGLTYENKSDTLEVGLEGYTHRISHPAQVFVEEQGTALSSVLAIDAEGLQHIIRLRAPLQLPRLKPLATR